MGLIWALSLWTVVTTLWKQEAGLQGPVSTVTQRRRERYSSPTLQCRRCQGEDSSKLRPASSPGGPGVFPQPWLQMGKQKEEAQQQKAAFQGWRWPWASQESTGAADVIDGSRAERGNGRGSSEGLFISTQGPLGSPLK